MTTKKILLIFGLWFILVNLFALTVLNRFNFDPDTAYTWIDPKSLSQDRGLNIVGLHSRWDSLWYIDIAENGYSMDHNQWGLYNIVFFPLYPMLMRVVSFLTGSGMALSGWIVSSLSLMGSLFILSKLVKEFHPESDPYYSLLYLLVFPTAFFFNSVYTESLFMLLSVSFFYTLFKKKYFFAGLLGLLASLTRVTGVLLAIPFLWEYFKDRGLRSFLEKRVLSIFFIPLGTFVFFLYHRIRFGSFMLFFEIERNWGRDFTLQKGHFVLDSAPATVNFLLDVFFVLFAVVVIYFLFKKKKTSYALYSLSTLVVALSTGTLMSIARYISVLFPIYILLSSKREPFRSLYLVGSSLLLALYTILFVNGYWAG